MNNAMVRDLLFSGWTRRKDSSDIQIWEKSVGEYSLTIEIHPNGEYYFRALGRPSSSYFVDYTQVGSLSDAMRLFKKALDGYHSSDNAETPNTND